MNPLEKEFAPYQESLELKELGFDEPCVYYVDKDNNSYIYNFQTHPDEFIEGCGVNVIPTPTFSQAFRWFREKYKLTPNIDRDGGCWLTCIIDFSHEDYETPKKIHIGFLEYEGDEYEDAELACLRKLIEIVKNYG